MKKGQHGYYYYRVYDAKTNELLAEGNCREVAYKMNWDVSYPANLISVGKRYPDAKKRFERVEHEWIDSIYEVYDKREERHFTGNYDECTRIIAEWTGYELKPATLDRYINNSSRRFRVKRLENA